MRPFTSPPYHIQIPLGMILAVTLAVSLVSVVSAQLSVRNARLEIVSKVQRVVHLLAAQGKPLLALDDPWRAYVLLRDTAVLLPQKGSSLSHAALLDAQGHTLAGSAPDRLPTGELILGRLIDGQRLPTAQSLGHATILRNPEGGMTFVEPIRSEDEEVMGFVLAVVDAAVFAPDWAALSTTALIGAGLSFALLIPLGWWLGRRMAYPVAQTAACIAQIGHTEPAQLQAQLPSANDPELNRIVGAVKQLLQETLERQTSTQRALSAERLAAVGRITAAVAHEINNPLAGLITATRTLRLHGDQPEARNRSLDLIERGLHQVRTICTALLPQARVEDRCMTPCDFDDILTLARTTAIPQDTHITYESKLDAPLHVPCTVFRQVMLNLLLNAIRAAGTKGNVHVKLCATPHAVRFCISNTGKHFSNESLQHRLDAKQSQDPNGFGLWICHEFAVRYSGGFEAAPAQTIAPPFSTRLEFWLPNLIRHDPTQPAAH